MNKLATARRKTVAKSRYTLGKLCHQMNFFYFVFFSFFFSASDFFLLSRINILRWLLIAETNEQSTHL